MKADTSVAVNGARASAEPEVAALARGLAVLRAVADAPRPLSNAELSATTGIPKATVSRLAGTLVAAGHLRQDSESDRYTLGPALLALGERYLQQFDLRRVVRPHFAALADLTGCSVHLGVRDGSDILIIDSVHASSAVITSRLGIGSRMPLATSASGRAYLAALPEADRGALLDELRTEWRGRGKVVEHLDAALRDQARHGFCRSFGEWDPQINAIGVALPGPRGERYAVSCGGPAHLLSEKFMLGTVAPALLQTLNDIAGDIGAAASS